MTCILPILTLTNTRPRKTPLIGIIRSLCNVDRATTLPWKEEDSISNNTKLKVGRMLVAAQSLMHNRIHHCYSQRIKPLINNINRSIGVRAEHGIAVDRFAREIGCILKALPSALAAAECQSVGRNLTSSRC